MSVLSIKKICVDYSISQSELAKRLEMPASNLARMLNNDDIKYSAIVKIAEALNTSVQELLGFSSSEAKDSSQYIAIIESQQDTIKSLQQSIENLTEAIKNISIK